MAFFTFEKKDYHYKFKIFSLKFSFKINQGYGLYFFAGDKKKQVKSIKGLKIFTEASSKNNMIIVERPFNFKNCSIHLSGSNNLVLFKKNSNLNGLNVYLYNNWNNRIVEIGEDVSINGAKIYCYGENVKISIGDDSMLSWGIVIRSSDAHAIVDLASGKNINHPADVLIGKHVWIGQDSYIGKNVQIADNCIIGAKAVVTKSFKNSYCAIAGNPAKVIKEGIDWKRDSY